MQLTASNLAKTYRNRVVIDDVSLNLNAGEIVGLLGPNGAGKTTCFYMIVGLIEADRGEIVLGSQTLTKAPVYQRSEAGIGYLPQDASIFRTLSAEDNLRAVLEINPRLSSAQQEARLEALIDEFNLTAVRKSLGQSLSGGERRRVEIARALASDPQFILLDEPFAGVDPISVHDIKDEIRHLSQRGIGVLITDHNVRETLDVCHRAYIVHQGRIIAEGNKHAILEDETVRQVYLGKEFLG